MDLGFYLWTYPKLLITTWFGIIGTLLLALEIALQVKVGGLAMATATGEIVVRRG